MTSHHAQENRSHRRLPLPCPVSLIDARGEVVAKARTLNISDGGAFFFLPPQSLPAFGAEVHLRLLVPRSTPNTFLFEPVEAQARVVRHQPLKDPSLSGVAVQFAKPLDLMLEV